MAEPANRPRLSASVSFPYRSGDDVGAETASGAVRYDVSYGHDKAAGISTPPGRPWRRLRGGLDELRAGRVLAVDLSAGHLATDIVDASGKPVGTPVTIPLNLAGLPAATRDGCLRAAICELIAMAETNDAKAVVVEDTDSLRLAARAASTPVAGRPGAGRRAFRRLVAGIPTARFRGLASRPA